MPPVAIDADATAVQGRGHARRGERPRIGWRNGSDAKGVQTEAGGRQRAVLPRRGTDEPCQPKRPERLASRTLDLEALVRGMDVRGLSTHDVGALDGETCGETRLSTITVRRITQPLNLDVETWRRRDVSDRPVVYRWLDGPYHAARQGTNEKEGVLSTSARLDDGQPVLRHLDVGSRESSGRVAQCSTGPRRPRPARPAPGRDGRGARAREGGEPWVAARLSAAMSSPPRCATSCRSGRPRRGGRRR
jgi:transposase-like protein